jgi:lipopolysaccharide transport system ATP-binding protein
MADTVIKVDNISKQYRLGEVSTGTLMHDINKWFYKVRGKESPYLKIGEENDRTKKTDSEYVWALKDINFEVKRGEALGIIGRNGAGKSTLLKILSRTTAPTIGDIKIKGRVASLLEVGTGFHPELTGRDNIFLNGAILGMTKREIKSKFDEIVDFAGVERYIDTPVKRYSSGMYVRLAFGVAAHLEPEILIVDEVLAVGDAEFQKKCLGKMKDVSVNDGRTVLFVSHNMTAIKSLCQTALLLDNGKTKKYGNITEVVDAYMQTVSTEFHKSWQWEKAPGTEMAKLLEIEIITDEDVLYIDNAVNIRFKVGFLKEKERSLNFSLVINNQEGIPVFNVGSPAKLISDKEIEAICHIPANFLNDEFYTIRILLVSDASVALFDLHDIMAFKMEERDRGGNWYGKWIGMVRPNELIKWTF